MGRENIVDLSVLNKTTSHHGGFYEKGNGMGVII